MGHCFTDGFYVLGTIREFFRWIALQTLKGVVLPICRREDGLTEAVVLGSLEEPEVEPQSDSNIFSLLLMSVG